MEILLYERAKDEGQDIDSEGSQYALFFGEFLKKFGTKNLRAAQKVFTPEEGKYLLKMFLEFNFCLAQVQEYSPNKEIYCASLNVSEVLRASFAIV